MFVYVVENTVNGKRYVGKSNMPAKRWTQHRINARNGLDSILCRAIRAHGEENFEFSIVEQCDTESASFEAECRWIAQIGTHGPGGYNATPGGEGIVVTDELRAKWSEMRRGVAPRPEAVAARAAGCRGNGKRLATLERIKKAFDPSLTHKQLAEKTGVSQGTIQSSLKELGLSTVHPRGGGMFGKKGRLAARKQSG